MRRLPQNLSQQQESSSSSRCKHCGLTSDREAVVISSPIPTLLRTNRVPSNEELEKAGQSVTDAQSALARLDGEISRIKTLLDGLERERLSVFLHVGAHQVHLHSPIRKLVPEVLSEVFLQCLPEKPILRLSQHDAPLLLAAVCRSWRNIAITTPRLWASLSIVAIDESLGSWEAKLPITREWLARSGACPLSIIISSMAMSGDLEPMIRGLAAYSHRLTHLDTDISQPLLEAMGKVKPVMDNLKSLSITRGDYHDLHARSLDAFARAVQLRHLKMAKLSPSILQLSWEKLTSFEATGVTTHEVVQMLQWSPCLHYCNVEISPHAQPFQTHQPSTPFLHKCLHTLHILSEKGALPGEVLNGLTLPSLKDIDLHFQDIAACDPESFVRLVLRSSTRLSKMFLNGIVFDGETLALCLALIPDVLDLQLWSNHVCEIGDFILPFDSNRIKSYLVPKTRNLRIAMGVSENFNMPALVKMVQSRYHRRPDATDKTGYLRQIWIHFWGGDEPWFAECFEELRGEYRDGLDTHVKIGQYLLRFDDPVCSCFFCFDLVS